MFFFYCSIKHFLRSKAVSIFSKKNYNKIKDEKKLYSNIIFLSKKNKFKKCIEQKFSSILIDHKKSVYGCINFLLSKKALKNSIKKFLEIDFECWFFWKPISISRFICPAPNQYFIKNPINNSINKFSYKKSKKSTINSILF